jgi:hypothetical protein
MLKGHYLELYHLTDDGTGKMRDESHPSVKHKMKDLWKNKVSPAFPGALSDTSIVKMPSRSRVTSNKRWPTL